MGIRAHHHHGQALGQRSTDEHAHRDLRDEEARAEREREREEDLPPPSVRPGFHGRRSYAVRWAAA